MPKILRGGQADGAAMMKCAQRQTLCMAESNGLYDAVISMRCQRKAAKGVVPGAKRFLCPFYLPIKGNKIMPFRQFPIGLIFTLIEKNKAASKGG
ncbi:hypothetical protein EBQ24_02430 [Allofranklinella schreckenbergeri]|uniref:Uncharacterized protein n=1 Tax=Allofranklinella schreckenbergeri TaxID=1076744 RepID=A0A3M6R851_9BURK|nr:hypothetical protein [Allofranklinella schreckenbergeri]RMX11040.1 hypothetical protein EBQ24_02430 [Allofranklinella schreckenbergeri]